MELNFDINWLAAIVGAVAAFIVGSVWYSPVLFSRIWQQEVKLTDADIRAGNMAVTFGSAFVLTLIGAILLAAYLGPEPELGDALIAGLVVGAGFISTAIGVVYLFERRSMTLFLINAGYQIATYLVIGLILGLWK
ncbi:MAG: DUF1761 domain-containing protein [Bauldia sp.]|nr:DUF1761 domain-containing protein [Bauldia sp.]